MAGMIHAVLFDLDGVVRHFDHDPQLERRHGLADGALTTAAFTAPLIDEVTTGGITRAAWIAAIGDTVGSAEAAAEWGQTPFHVDPDLLVLADDLRAQGLIAAILTNGTDTIVQEAARAGITEHFHPIFNSAEIGHAKPDARAFLHVLHELRLAPEHVLFTDDSASKLAGAIQLGMPTHHFTGIRGLRVALRAQGIALGDVTAPDTP